MKEDCKPFMERLCDALSEDLSSPLCQELQDHLKQCPDCSLQVDTIKRTVELYQALPLKKVPGEVKERLWARLKLPPVEGNKGEQG